MLRAWAVTAALAVALASACHREEGLPSKPRAIELEEEAPPPSASAEAARTSTSARAPRPATPRDLGFPLPVAPTTTIERRLAPVMANTRELQQLVLRSPKPVADLARYYERAMGDAGYRVDRSGEPGEPVLLRGRKDVGRDEVVVVVMRAPDSDETVISLSSTRVIQP